VCLALAMAPDSCSTRDYPAARLRIADRRSFSALEFSCWDDPLHPAGSIEPRSSSVSFLTFVEDRGEDHLNNEAALAWATLPKARSNLGVCPLSVVRRFAKHLRGIDPATRGAPTHLLVQQKAEPPLPIFGVGYRGSSPRPGRCGHRTEWRHFGH